MPDEERPWDTAPDASGHVRGQLSRRKLERRCVGCCDAVSASHGAGSHQRLASLQLLVLLLLQGLKRKVLREWQPRGLLLRLLALHIIG
jgi:hypothetical protein